MPVGIEEQGRKFITTELLGKNGETTEQKVWDTVRSSFAERQCLGYWRYPIFSKVGECRKEPDILVVDAELGLIVIEVKAVTIKQIAAINGHRWEFQDFYDYAYNNPYEQAETQLFALLGYCDREPTIRRKVTGRVMVALPLISEKEWQQRGFDQLPSCPPILFREHLNPVALLQRISQAPPVMPGIRLDDQQWELLLSVIGGSPVYRKPSRPTTSSGKTRSSIIASLRDRLYELDLQQEHIGKEIPPGVQRLRGTAGSGKTVLLCQKAAHMHLKHPDWDIALVFFTRSLYENIIEQIDKWMRHFSGGEIEYSRHNPKLKVLHAWGARNQPGFYRLLCEEHKERPQAIVSGMAPDEGLAYVCKQFLKSLDNQGKEIQPKFDAILIDEGQDLVVDDELKYEDKQVFYWLAYKALRPVEPSTPEQRRLIWAYDEAQSLDNIKIPTAKEIFGESLSKLVQGNHKGGIKKNEIMHRCYRTPGPILTAAHAIGMGLLRPEGMLSGLTQSKDWQTIGYEVEGKFLPGQRVTLHRPPENSPNLVPELWAEPVLEFKTYVSRQDELSALAADIRHNLEHDGLKPSREILVIVLGSSFEAIALETHVARFLIEQGIQIFIPSALECNILKPKYPNHDPNKFWCEGGVTVSRIHRAKGNEADMVYVIGLDNIAKSESDLNLRNQLFVALTRARGWAKLSGIGQAPLYEEMTAVINSGNTFHFTFRRPPKRDMGEINSEY